MPCGHLITALVALTLLSASAGAQDSQDSVMVQAQVASPKPAVIDRVLEVMTKEGVVVTQATPAGTVTGQYIDGSIIITVFATVFTSSNGRTTVSLAANATTRANLLGTPQIGDFVHSNSPRQGKAAWAKLHRIADAVRES